MKLIAYIIELRWSIANGVELRRDYLRTYRAGVVRTYADEKSIGRPRPFTMKSDLDSNLPSARSLFGYLFKTPVLVISSAVMLVLLASSAPNWSAVVAAVLLAGLMIMMLATALTNRMILGPLDRFNPDLNVGGRVSKILYPGTSSLSLYILTLVFTSILGFTGVYAGVSHAAVRAFSENQAVDPIRWLYFTATIASTVGFGDIHATSDLGRLCVLLQIAGGTLLVTWAFASFFGETLLPPDDPGWTIIDRESK